MCGSFCLYEKASWSILNLSFVRMLFINITATFCKFSEVRIIIHTVAETSKCEVKIVKGFRGLKAPFKIFKCMPNINCWQLLIYQYNKIFIFRILLCPMLIRQATGFTSAGIIASHDESHVVNFDFVPRWHRESSVSTYPLLDVIIKLFVNYNWKFSPKMALWARHDSY